MSSHIWYCYYWTSPLTVCDLKNDTVPHCSNLSSSWSKTGFIVNSTSLAFTNFGWQLCLRCKLASNVFMGSNPSLNTSLYLSSDSFGTPLQLAVDVRNLTCCQSSLILAHQSLPIKQGSSLLTTYKHKLLTWSLYFTLTDIVSIIVTRHEKTGLMCT